MRVTAADIYEMFDRMSDDELRECVARLVMRVEYLERRISATPTEQEEGK
jgi:hypothetical protein